jgi:hypothetical protein
VRRALVMALTNRYGVMAINVASMLVLAAC